MPSVRPETVSHVRAIRRDLHQHPELGYQEMRTRGIVERELTDLGVAYVGGVGQTGVVGYLPASAPSPETKTVALRADMDALPIAEETGLPYASVHPGVMHACGHDGHTAILLGTVRELVGRDRPNHTILLFQPAEEGGAGGKALTDAGALRGEIIGTPVDAVFGLHGNPHIAAGSVRTRPGTLMASAAQFRVAVHGKGAHAAAPHTGIDPIVVASHIVTALQTVASRNVDPLESVVVTIGQFHAGVAHNVIPERADLHGTVRTLNEATERIALPRIEALVRDVAQAFGARAEISWSDNPYPATINDAVLADHVLATAAATLGADRSALEPVPVMGGEDFSFYGREKPACFYWLGLLPPGTESLPNLHAPRFDFNDEALEPGIAMMLALATSPLPNRPA
ncbi:MAG: M20 family metallopeptidase [Fimbriimonadaceae bacterium]|nr:M20 family metallopeptidase [Fimbriimonadaceae bacterium]